MPDTPRFAAPVRPGLLWAAAVLGSVLASTVARPAQDPPANPADEGLSEGRFVTVSNPIDSAVLGRIRDTVNAALNRDPNIRKIVFDFNPDNKPASTSDFGICSDLADFIAGLPKTVTTVAFVHGKTTRHTVLPVLACQELVMSREAALGEVFAEGQPIDPDKRQVYLKRLADPALAGLLVKMLDRGAEVWKGRKDGADWYYDGRQQAEAQKQGITNGRLVEGLPAGSPTLLTGRQARDLGLCRRVLETRQAVAEDYRLTPNSLREDSLQGRELNAWLVEVRGPVDAALKESLERQLKRAVSHGATLVFLRLECSGGDPVAAGDLAKFLMELRSDDGQSPVRTVAYVPGEAPGAAAFLAFGCSEIVMSERAKLGDFSAALAPNERRRDDRNEDRERGSRALADALAEIAERQGYSPALARGLALTDLVIVQAERPLPRGLERRLMTEEQFEKERAEDPHWRKLRDVKRAGALMPLTADVAREYGVARYVVKDAGNLKELYNKYGILEEAKVHRAGPDWLDAIAEFLRRPAVSVLLIMIGIGCLIMELKMPGFGIPGVVAALCFVLFFWAQSQLSGQIIYLALLLFLLGLVLIGIEIFLLPGFGVTGVSGVVLVMAGLGLATVQKMPQTSAEWADLGTTLTTFSIAMIAAAVGALIFARYLPNIPYANRLVLVPPTERPAEEAEASPLPPIPGVESVAALLGAVGVAATALRPSGMARFGDTFVDVISDGGYVPAGARVQVIEIEGNRVVVKEV